LISFVVCRELLCATTIAIAVDGLTETVATGTGSTMRACSDVFVSLRDDGQK